MAAGARRVSSRSVFRPEMDYIGTDLPGNAQADVEINDGIVDLSEGSMDLIVFDTGARARP